MNTCLVLLNLFFGAFLAYTYGSPGLQWFLRVPVDAVFLLLRVLLALIVAGPAFALAGVAKLGQWAEELLDCLHTFARGVGLLRLKAYDRYQELDKKVRRQEETQRLIHKHADWQSQEIDRLQAERAQLKQQITQLEAQSSIQGARP